MAMTVTLPVAVMAVALSISLTIALTIALASTLATTLAVTLAIALAIALAVAGLRTIDIMITDAVTIRIGVSGASLEVAIRRCGSHVAIGFSAVLRRSSVFGKKLSDRIELVHS